ncbi:MAG: asparagine synthase (glutamine-hydrolyzing) [Patescibacteria group bacterium]
MCGIAGFYGFRNDELIARFSDWLQHRGPDGDGFFLSDEITLLNRRLAIIDIQGGDQPIENEDGNIVVVYNGEIYNYRELRKKLIDKGHHFKTKSDTEVIVHGYEEWGDRCFEYLNGMFGLALYDKTKETLILARDHFGIKPLYYTVMPNDENPKAKLVFSSEIKPIIYSGLIKNKPNDRIIYRYLRYRIHDDGEDTFFEGVKRLLPGQMMTLRHGNIKIKSYTNLKNELLANCSGPGKSLNESDVSDFKKLLTDSVKGRLISEVPVGTCLSGGIDSSSVVALIRKLLDEHASEAESVGNIQRTFSAVFPYSINDEEKYIDLFLQNSINIKDYKVYPKAKELFQNLKDFVKTQEEPTISTGPYAQYQVMRRARDYVAVLLDGQGADEIMAGYLPYHFVYFNQLLKEKKYKILAKELIQSLDIIGRYFWMFLINKNNGVIHKLLNKDFSKKFKNEIYTIENRCLKKRLIEDIFINSLPALLRYEDKNAMRFSIEGRVPFLDFNLIRKLFTLPDCAIIENGWNKNILRNAVKDIIPEAINKRRNKTGFTTPEHEWFLEIGEEIEKIFMNKDLRVKKYINQAELILAFKKFMKKENDDTMLFWRVLNLELWLKEFFADHNQNFPVQSIKKIESSKNKAFNKDIRLNGKVYARHTIKTDLFAKGDAVADKISQILYDSINQLIKSDERYKSKKWFAVVSEKIVATAQGRSYFVWDIQPSFLAYMLSRLVSRVPWGIGLGSPWTMQLAIQEVGIWRILCATFVSGFTRPFGIRGLFYRIAGKEAAGIDGPTEYSLYPANLSAKLLPKNPKKVCYEIDRKILHRFKISNLKHRGSNPSMHFQNYMGSAIIDANDIGRNVLGNSTSLPDKLIEDVFQDNPMGQSDEQTPVTIVFIN